MVISADIFAVLLRYFESSIGNLIIICKKIREKQSDDVFFLKKISSAAEKTIAYVL